MRRRWLAGYELRTLAARRCSKNPRCAARHDHRSDSDYYTQPGNLFRLMDATAKERLINNIVGSLGNGVPKRIKELQIQHFYRADPAYGTGEAKGLGLDINSLVAQKQASAAD